MEKSSPIVYDNFYGDAYLVINRDSGSYEEAKKEILALSADNSNKISLEALENCNFWRMLNFWPSQYDTINERSNAFSKCLGILPTMTDHLVVYKNGRSTIGRTINTLTWYYNAEDEHSVLYNYIYMLPTYINSAGSVAPHSNFAYTSRLFAETNDQTYYPKEAIIGFATYGGDGIGTEGETGLATYEMRKATKQAAFDFLDLFLKILDKHGVKYTRLLMPE